MARNHRPAPVGGTPERSLFEHCLDLCSSQAEREKVRSLAIRLHLSETASEWAILLLHAEGRALFGGPRPKPPAATPAVSLERRIVPLSAGTIAGGAIATLLTQHASVCTMLAELALTGISVAWALRSR